MSKTVDELAAEDYFANIPVSILFADISSSAIRLYAVLRRHADMAAGAFPSRQRLADLMHLKSPRSVDTALAELVKLGAVSVEPRYDGGRQTSNLYTVRSTLPGGVQKTATSGVQKTATSGVQKTATSGVQKTATSGVQKTAHETEPEETEPEETLLSAELRPARRNGSEPLSAQTLVGEWIDYRTKTLNGVRPTGRVIGQLSKEIKLLLDEGQPYADVRAGLQLWDSKGLHPSTLASCVDQARAPVAPANGRHAREEQIFARHMDLAAAGAANPLMTEEDRRRAR